VATDSGLPAPELAGIARVKSAKSNRRQVRQLPHPPLRQAQALPNVPDITTNKELRDRAILAVLLGCALRRSAAAALTDGRSSGGFTPEATVAARDVNAPELSMVMLPVLLTVRVIAAEVFPHFAPVSPPPCAHPPRCQRNRPQDTQNPAHGYSLLLRNLAVNRLAVPHVPHAARRRFFRR
jgi:hypothetical protein